MPDLFTPVTLGQIALPNRILMAPMTRSRANAQGVLSDLTVEYYRQRAGAGLIITEATQTSFAGQGYARTPGMHTPEQIAAWKNVTAAVHAAGGRIFAQLFHVGRIAHAANRVIADAPVAPSAITANGQVWTDAQGMQPFDAPRALETAEVKAIVEEFRTATANALEAGFDGVELHAASGYLHMQFLSSNSNQRDDEYGGSAENRARFVVETLRAMVDVAGAGRVGVKLSPEMKFNDVQDADPVAAYSTLVELLNPLGLAYLHLMRASATDYLAILRPIYQHAIVMGAGFNQETANAVLAGGQVEAVVFGRLFISNPDLPERFRLDAELAPAVDATFYTPGAEGYTTYPALG